MEEQKLILSHPTGNANVRALAQGLVEKNILQRFYTCIAIFQSQSFYSITRFGPLKEFEKRVFPDQLRPYTDIRPLKELGRLVSKKLGKKKFIEHEKGSLSTDKIYRDLDHHVSRRLRNTMAVYAFEDGAYQTFSRAKLSNLTCIYDLPIGYWRAMHHLLEKERDEQPLWSSTIEGFKDSPEKLNMKDEELRMADHIFVASSFTKKTLQMFPGALAPIKVIPYGFPCVAKDRIYTPLKNRPLKLLFVGGLSQRKGISYLFKAVEKLAGRVTLTIVGEKPTEHCEVLNSSLKSHTWIRNLAHEEVLKLMKTHDLLIFPSLFEGFGLVITEAMSQGTPVITTNRTCGPDVISHGRDGWLVEAGSAKALESQIEDILDNPYLIEQVGRAALETAAKRPWHMYGAETAGAINQIFEEVKVVC